MCRREDISNALVHTVRLTGERRPKTKRATRRGAGGPTPRTERMTERRVVVPKYCYALRRTFARRHALSREVDPLSETSLCFNTGTSSTWLYSLIGWTRLYSFKGSSSALGSSAQASRLHPPYRLKKERLTRGDEPVEPPMVMRWLEDTVQHGGRTRLVLEELVHRERAPSK